MNFTIFPVLLIITLYTASTHFRGHPIGPCPVWVKPWMCLTLEPA